MDTTVNDEVEGSGSGGPAAQSAEVDRILSLLDDLDDLPVPGHVGVYLDVHERLSGALNPGRTPRQAGTHGTP